MRRFYFFDIREQTCFNTFAPDEEKKSPFFCVRKPRSFAEFIFAAGLTIGKHNHDKTGCSANIPMPTRAEPCRGIAPSMPKMQELNAVRHDARLFLSFRPLKGSSKNALGIIPPPDGFDTQKYGVISRIKSKEYCLQQRPLPPVYRLDRENRSNCYKS